MITTKSHTIQLVLNGYEYTSDDISLEYLVVYESVQLSLPSVVIHGKVPESKSIEFLSSDNVTGKLVISKIVDNTTNKIVDMPVKVFSVKGGSNEESSELLITLIYNWKFALDSNYYYLTASSSMLFRAVGLSQGFYKTYISSSSDTMTWINPGQRGVNFLNDVSSAAYASNSSCFLWGVRANNELIYRDISVDNPALQNKIYLVNGSKNIAMGHRIDSNIGIFNGTYGYGRNTDLYHYEDNTLDTSLGATYVKPEGTQVLITKSVDQGTFRSPMDAGNTHENYQKAILQNLRLKSAYNTKITFPLYDDNSDIQLLEDVTVVNNSQKNSSIENLCGVVSQRTLKFTVKELHYDITIETNAFNAKGL